MTHFIIFSAQYLHWIISGIAAIFVSLKLSENIKPIFSVGVMASLIALAVDKILNQFVQSPRPFSVEKITPLFFHIADNGFPSEHTLFAMVAAGVIFIYHRKAGILLGIMAFWVGLARVISNVHHFTDIVGSVVIAIVAVIISWHFLTWLNKR